jgi:hypothetical protein
MVTHLNVELNAMFAARNNTRVGRRGVPNTLFYTNAPQDLLDIYHCRFPHQEPRPAETAAHYNQHWRQLMYVGKCRGYLKTTVRLFTSR